jgi:hypothetical protein
MMPDDTNRSTGCSPNESTVRHTSRATASAHDCYSSTADDALLNMYYMKDVTIVDDPAADDTLQDLGATLSHHHQHQGPHDDDAGLVAHDHQFAQASLSVDEDDNHRQHASLLSSSSSSSSAGGVSPSVHYERRGRFAIWPAHLGLVCPMSTDGASSTASAH